MLCRYFIINQPPVIHQLCVVHLCLGEDKATGCVLMVFGAGIMSLEEFRCSNKLDDAMLLVPLCTLDMVQNSI